MSSQLRMKGSVTPSSSRIFEKGSCGGVGARRREIAWEIGREGGRGRIRPRRGRGEMEGDRTCSELPPAISTRPRAGAKRLPAAKRRLTVTPVCS